MVKRRAIVLVISNFIGEDYEKIIQITNEKHNCISIIYAVDPRQEKRYLPSGLSSWRTAKSWGAYHCRHERPGVCRDHFEKLVREEE